MKTYNRSNLPESIVYNGDTYRLNAAISAGMIANNTSLRTIAHTLKKEGRKMVVVNCLAKGLKGKTDLHGQPYKPNVYIYTTSI